MSWSEYSCRRCGRAYLPPEEMWRRAQHEPLGTCKQCMKKPTIEFVEYSCTKCLATKPKSEMRKVSKTKPTGTCGKCAIEYAGYAHKLTPDRRATYRLKQVYGLTPSDRDAILKEQNGCGVCHRWEPRGGKWAIDHCHETGRVRGVLCFNCNTGLGKAGDSIESLAAYLIYLLTSAEKDGTGASLLRESARLALGGLLQHPLVYAEARRFDQNHMVEPGGEVFGRSRFYCSQA